MICGVAMLLLLLVLLALRSRVCYHFDPHRAAGSRCRDLRQASSLKAAVFCMLQYVPPFVFLFRSPGV
jgi:hypothetical protein